jgi:hypothetical protein
MTRQDGTKITNHLTNMITMVLSRSPLQRCGFDEFMPLEGWAVFRMIFPTPSSKRFNRFNKLK